MRLLLLMAAASAAGCHRAPSARVVLTRYPDSNQALVECRVRGVASPQFRWTFGRGIHPPHVATTATVLVGTESRAKSGTAEIRCEVTGAGGEKVAAATSLLEPKIVAAFREPNHAPIGTPPPGALIGVDGSDLGSNRTPDDTLWLVPRWGRPHALDHDCRDANWSDTQIRACIPNIPTGQYQLRVESGGRLAVGGSLTIGAKSSRPSPSPVGERKGE